MRSYIKTFSNNARRISQAVRAGASELSARTAAARKKRGGGKEEGEDDTAWPDLRLAFESPSHTLEPDPTSFDSYFPLPPSRPDSRRLSARSPYTGSTASTSSTATETLRLESPPPSVTIESFPPLPSLQPFELPRPVSDPSATLSPVRRTSRPYSPPQRRSLLTPPPVPVKELALAPCELGTAFAAFLEDIAYGEKAARQVSARPTSRRIGNVDSLSSKRTSRSRSAYLPSSRRWSRWSEETEVDSEESLEEEESDGVSMLCATAAMLEGRWMVSPGF